MPWHDHDVEGLVRENQMFRLALEEKSKALANALNEREAACREIKKARAKIKALKRALHGQ